VELLISQSFYFAVAENNERTASNPCIPRGFELTPHASDRELVKSHGAGNFSACKSALMNLLNGRQGTLSCHVTCFVSFLSPPEYCHMTFDLLMHIALRVYIANQLKCCEPDVNPFFSLLCQCFTYTRLICCANVLLHVGKCLHPPCEITISILNELERKPHPQQRFFLTSEVGILSHAGNS